VPDACEVAGGLVDDCDGNGVPDVCDLAGGAGDCNANGALDSCDLAGGVSQDLNENQVPDECEVDCNGNGRPDDVEVTPATDCDANGRLDTCDLAANPDLDMNSNGIPDSCDSSAVVRLAARPDPVVNAAGTQAVALVSTLSADPVEDILWEGAVFRDVGDGVLADLVRAARLVLDSNGDGRPDPDEEVIGTSEGDFADERIVFGNLSRRIAAGDTSRYLLVLDLDTAAGTGAGVRVGSGAVTGPPPPALPSGAVGWLAALAFLALTLSLRAGVWSGLGGGDSSWFAAHRRRLHLAVPTLAALVLAAAMLPLGCSSGGGGGGGGSQGQPAAARTLQLELIEVEATGANSGDTSLIDGLPLTAWEFEA